MAIFFLATNKLFSDTFANVSARDQILRPSSVNMLQNRPVEKLKNANQNRVAYQQAVEPIVYRESNVITAQPARFSSMTNIERPISMIFDQAVSSFTRSGLENLRRIPSVHIQQTVEINETNLALSTENRFTVRGPANEAIFGALESSNARQRTFCGTNRSFSMHIVDRSQQETLTFQRSVSLGLCCLTCKTEKLSVWAPPGDLLGEVKQTFGITATELQLLNATGNILYRIPLPTKMCLAKELHFKILTADTLMQSGSITRIWNTDISCFTTNVYFSDPGLDSRLKALFLASAFLLEYMYFQSKLGL